MQTGAVPNLRSLFTMSVIVFEFVSRRFKLSLQANFYRNYLLTSSYSVFFHVKTDLLWPSFFPGKYSENKKARKATQRCNLIPVGNNEQELLLFDVVLLFLTKNKIFMHETVGAIFFISNGFGPV